jgi:hypothetical protein
MKPVLSMDSMRLKWGWEPAVKVQEVEAAPTRPKMDAQALSSVSQRMKDRRQKKR